MQGPRCGLIEAALDCEGSIGRLVRNLELNPARGVRQNKRFADLKIFDHERPAFEELHAGFQSQINKRGRRENDVILDLVVF